MTPDPAAQVAEEDMMARMCQVCGHHRHRGSCQVMLSLKIISVDKLNTMFRNWTLCGCRRSLPIQGTKHQSAPAAR